MELQAPMNLPLLINDPRPSARNAVMKILGGSLDLEQQINLLSKYFKTKVWFSKPLHIISFCGLHPIVTDCHIFDRISISNGELIYRNLKVPIEYILPLECMTKWEPVPYSKKR